MLNLIIVILILFALWFSWKRFKSNPRGSKLILSFKRIVFSSEYDINLGDIVTLWPKPATNEIHVYHRSSVAGSGFLGKFKSPHLAKQYPSSTYRIKTTVVEIQGDTVVLSNDLEIIDKREEQNKSTKRFLDALKKPFTPKGPVNVIFNMPDDFQWNTRVQLAILTTEKTKFYQIATGLFF